MTEHRWTLITMANDGVSVGATAGDVSLSGPTRRDLPRLVAQAAEGAYVLDLEPVPTDEAFRHSLSGPLPDCTREGGDLERLELDEQTQPIVDAWGARGLCLDRVGLADYCEGWRRLGARVGRVVDGELVWEVDHEKQ